METLREAIEVRRKDLEKAGFIVRVIEKGCKVRPAEIIGQSLDGSRWYAVTVRDYRYEKILSRLEGKVGQIVRHDDSKNFYILMQIKEIDGFSMTPDYDFMSPEEELFRMFFWVQAEIEEWEVKRVIGIGRAA